MERNSKLSHVAQMLVQKNRLKFYSLCPSEQSQKAKFATFPYVAKKTLSNAETTKHAWTIKKPTILVVTGV